MHRCKYALTETRHRKMFVKKYKIIDESGYPFFLELFI